MDTKFEPKHISFKEGIDRIHEAMSSVGFKHNSRILTSRDADAVKMCNLLNANDSVPDGFQKWQLPFYLEGGQFFITTAGPNLEVGQHAHDNDGVRFILSGSIFYDGIELDQGDWMYLPKGQRYSFKTGPLGALMAYCYQCCCGGRELRPGAEVINPAYVRQRSSIR